GGAVVLQTFIRFDAEDGVIELRARYVEGPAHRGTGWMGELLAALKKRCGAPLEQPTTWAALWADLPTRKPTPVLYQWQDDRALLAYERDSAAVEVRLCDVTKQAAEAQPLLPLEYLPLGPDNCLLGTPRAELL